MPTLGTLDCLEKLVQTYSCKGQYSGTSVARPLKFCVSYRGLKSYLWSNFHASVTSGSRVIEGSHCPKWFCFYRSMFLTVPPSTIKRTTSIACNQISFDKLHKNQRKWPGSINTMLRKPINGQLEIFRGLSQ